MRLKLRAKVRKNEKKREGGSSRAENGKSLLEQAQSSVWEEVRNCEERSDELGIRQLPAPHIKNTLN